MVRERIRHRDGESICTDASGNVYIIGVFGSPIISFGATSLVTSSINGIYDGYFVKYDSSGNVLWAKDVGGTGGDYGYGISTYGNGNVYVTGGFTAPSITLGTNTLTNQGDFDIYAAAPPIPLHVGNAATAEATPRCQGRAL